MNHGGVFIGIMVVIVFCTGLWLFFGNAMPSRKCHDFVVREGECFPDQVLDISQGVAVCRCKIK